MILVPGRATHSLQEHRAIVDAVAAHDPDAAEAATRRHLSHSAQALRQSRKLTTEWSASGALLGAFGCLVAQETRTFRPPLDHRLRVVCYDLAR